MLKPRSASCTLPSPGTGRKSVRWSGSSMWKSQLAKKTTTEEIKIGSHSEGIETTLPPANRDRFPDLASREYRTGHESDDPPTAPFARQEVEDQRRRAGHPASGSHCRTSEYLCLRGAP